MELFAIVLAGPFALVASAVYCLVVTRVAARWSRTRSVLMAGSLLVLGLLVLEAVLLAGVGARRLHRILGPAFYTGHLVLFFLGTPALANVLTLRDRPGLLGKWYVAALVCAPVAVALVLLQYGVSEALFGID